MLYRNPSENNIIFIMVLSSIAFVVCVLCFIRVGLMINSYDLIVAGYNTSNCTTIEYRSGYYAESCLIYSYELCSNGWYANKLMSRPLPCVEFLIKPYLEKDPIGSVHVRYYFNKKPTKYYSQDQIGKFIRDHGKNPRISVIVLSSFTGLFAFILSASTVLYFFIDVRKLIMGESELNQYSIVGQDEECDVMLPA